MTSHSLGWRGLLAPPYAPYLAIFGLGSALSAFAAFLVSAAMPSAVQGLGHLDLMSWGFTFYLIAAIIAGILASPLKWRLGTGAALQGAALTFLLGSLACGFAPDIWVLLGGRVAQGLGEGAVSGLTYILIPEIFPAAAIPAVFGLEAVIWAAGALAGPIVGGYLTQAVSWRAAFLVEVPPILIFMALVWSVIPRRGGLAVMGDGRGRSALGRLPIARLAGVAGGILLLSLAAIEGALWARLLSAAAALAWLALIARRDLAAANRLLPRGAFSWQTGAGLAFWVVLLMPAAHTGPATYLILFIERLWGYGPLPAAILGAAMVAAWGAVGLVVSRAAARRAPGFLWGGPALLALGLLLGWLAMDRLSLGLLLASQAIIGTGYGLAWGFLSQTVMTGTAEPAERDRASAMLPGILSTGLAIGAALGGITANAAGLAAGVSEQIVLRAALWCFAVAAVPGFAAFGIALRLRHRVKREGRGRA
ncbi:MFS transporter [Acidisoma sp. C75]